MTSGITSQGRGQDLTRHEMKCFFGQVVAEHAMMLRAVVGHDMTRDGTT